MLHIDEKIHLFNVIKQILHEIISLTINLYNDKVEYYDSDVYKCNPRYNEDTVTALSMGYNCAKYREVTVNLK